MKTIITTHLNRLRSEKNLETDEVEAIYNDISKKLSEIKGGELRYTEVQTMHDEIIASTHNTYADQHHTKMLELSDRLVELKRLVK